MTLLLLDGQHLFLRLIVHSLKFSDLKKYVETPDAKTQHGIRTVRNTIIDQKPAVELTFDHEDRTFKGYGIQSAKENVDPL